MKKLRFVSIFLVAVLLSSLLSTTALASTAGKSTSGKDAITIAAKAALLVDADTGQILLNQNADTRLYPASITKCMTALLVLEAIDAGKLSLNQTITASQSAINMLTDDSSTADIKVGEQLTVEQLLYCVMVQSANEACYILAEAVSGSIDTFVDAMNKKAEELGCENTHFINPCGLHDSAHYTSAWDVYLITKAAMEYSMFMTIANTTVYQIPATNLSEARTLRTTNYLMDQWRAKGYLYSPTRGIKTGHTSDAGYCLVSSAEKGERGLISVVLGAEKVTNDDGSSTVQSFSETKRMFEWGFSNFQRTAILDHASLVTQVDVTLSRKTNYVALHPAEDVEALLPSSVKAEELKQEITLDAESVEAPVEKGQKLGTITVSDGNGSVYAEVDLLAANEVPLSKMLQTMHQLELFFSHTIVKVLAVVIVLAVGALIVSILRRRPKRYRGGQSYRTRKRSNYRGKRR